MECLVHHSVHGLHRSFLQPVRHRYILFQLVSSLTFYFFFEYLTLRKVPLQDPDSKFTTGPARADKLVLGGFSDSGMKIVSASCIVSERLPQSSSSFSSSEPIRFPSFSRELPSLWSLPPLGWLVYRWPSHTFPSSTRPCR